MQKKSLTKPVKSPDFNRIKALFIELREKLNLSSEELLNLLEEENLIPISIFSTNLAPLESLVKYAKENLNFSFSKIASVLKRDQRTIWSAYQSSVKKKTRLNIKSDIFITLAAFSDRRFSILESLVMHLKDKYHLTFHKIALLLNKDDRTIWTVYSRAKKKEEKYAKK